MIEHSLAKDAISLDESETKGRFGIARRLRSKLVKAGIVRLNKKHGHISLEVLWTQLWRSRERFCLRQEPSRRRACDTFRTGHHRSAEIGVHSARSRAARRAEGSDEER